MNANKNRLIAVASMLVIAFASISAVEAGHKQSRHSKHSKQRNPLVRLAVDIEDQARFVERRAERAAGRGLHGEYRALVRLDEVQRQARDFRKTLERNGPNSRRTDRELLELDRALNRAARTLPALRAFRRVRGDFRTLSRMVDDMQYRLQTRTARHDGGRRQAYPVAGRGSRGYVSIGKNTRNGHASFGFSWDDED